MVEVLGHFLLGERGGGQGGASSAPDVVHQQYLFRALAASNFFAKFFHAGLLSLVLRR